MDDEYDIIDTLSLDNPEKDRAWMECDHHDSCRMEQETVADLFDTLADYDRLELSYQQNRFLDWFLFFGE